MAENTALLFRASPTMRTCGYLIAGSGSYALRLLVLPRFWAEAGTTPARYWFEKDGQTLTVLAYEGQVVSVPVDRSNLPVWSDVLDAAARLADTVTVEVREDDELGDTDVDVVDRPNEDFAPALASRGRANGTRRVRMPLCSLWSRPPEVAAELSLDEEAFRRELAGFGTLLQRAAERMRPTPLGDGDPSPAVTTGGDGANLLRLLLAHRALVSFIKQNVHRIRRGYLEVTETMPVIRGRITQRGVISAVSGSSLAIECTHDEFSELTPLFRLLMTALDRVAQSLPASAEAVLFPQQQAEAAASLRAQLLPIPSMPLQEANSLAPRMQLRGRLRAEWQEALELARIVLAPEQSTQFDLSRLRTVGAAVQVVTSTFWEQAVVEPFLGNSKPTPIDDEQNVWVQCGSAKQPDCILYLPMGKLAGKYPADILKIAHDLLVGEPGRRAEAPTESAGLVFDAKYARARKTKIKTEIKTEEVFSVPPAGYQYQMLAYSLLVPRCHLTALVYPRSSASEPTAAKTWKRAVPHRWDWSPNENTPEETNLMVLEAPFPTAQQCESDETWATYRDEFRAAVLRAAAGATLGP